MKMEKLMTSSMAELIEYEKAKADYYAEHPVRGSKKAKNNNSKALGYAKKRMKKRKAQRQARKKARGKK